MSSALAMVLMAGIAVPGNGPERVSEEVEQGLDLSGEWEGTYRGGGGHPWKVRLRGGILAPQNALTTPGVRPTPIQFVDDGNGKVRLGTKGHPSLTHCAYKKVEGDRIIITFSPEKTDERLPWVLILKRVKPRK